MQVQVKPPPMLLHVAFSWQLSVFCAHSSTSKIYKVKCRLLFKITRYSPISYDYTEEYSIVLLLKMLGNRASNVWGLIPVQDLPFPVYPVLHSHL